MPPIELMEESQQIAVNLIRDYRDTWDLLFKYDEDQFDTPTGHQGSGALDYGFALSVIRTFQDDLATQSEASSLFGVERDSGLKAILGNIEQTMFCKPLYGTLEEKAAHLLYFLIKDHPFIDGNKRIGSLLFLLYLNQEEVATRVDPHLLAYVTLWLA